MAAEVDHSQADTDTDMLHDINIDLEEEDQQPKLSAKETSQQVLEIRRKLEDRLERRRLRDELGCDDLWELDF